MIRVAGRIPGALEEPRVRWILSIKTPRVPGMAADALGSEHKKPRRAAGFPGPAGLCVGYTIFSRISSGI